MALRPMLGWSIVILLALFVGFNWTSARVEFFGISVQMPLAFVVLISAGLGAAATLAFRALKHRGR
jgi:uncharacterized integral membrane protein